MTAPSPILPPYSGLTYRSARRYMARQFEQSGLPFADEDALDLLLGLGRMSHADFVARGTDFVAPDLLDNLRAAADRRLAGEPVDRILGWREFYGRRFAIDHVLSPRGDTEVLLLAALKALEAVPAPHILDLGTGSGALAISVLAERPQASGVATDLSDKALATAARNGEAHAVSNRLTLQRSDWFDAVPRERRFDAVLSNPPYITDAAMAALSQEVAGYDPEMALAGGPDGLAPYRVIIAAAPRFLKAGGWLGVEIGFDQGEAVRSLFRDAGFDDVMIQTDPAGLDRIVTGYAPATDPGDE